MSFLYQLQQQANQLQNAQAGQQKSTADQIQETESACKNIDLYMMDLAQQLSIIEPRATKVMYLDGKDYWPEMKMVAHITDSRKKTFHNQTIFDYIALTWRIVPVSGKPLAQFVDVNFPPNLQRVQERLAQGQMQYDQEEVRHPEKNTLLAYRFNYRTQARGVLRITPKHDQGVIDFYAANTNGFDQQQARYRAAAVNPSLLDELAKFIALQPSTFF